MIRLPWSPVVVLLLCAVCPLQAQTLEDEICRFRAECAKLLAENKALRAEFEKLLAENTALRAEFEKLLAENKALRSELGLLKSLFPLPGKLPIPLDKWNLSYFDDEAFNVRPKAITFDTRGDVKVLLEIKKTISLEMNAPIEEHFAVGLAPIFTFDFIDADGVTLSKVRHYRVEGEVTGRAKDAFRLVLRLPDPDFVRRTARVEVRKFIH
jgi:hypothetical protein